MKKRIALLRGINVGGKRKILMVDLRGLLTDALEFKNVTTYIQSGNILFHCEEIIPSTVLEDSIKQLIFDAYGFEVPTIVRRVEELEDLVFKNPFLETAEISELYVTFLKEVPTTEVLEFINEFDATPDKFQIVKNNIYGYCSGKYSDSKLTNNFFEKKLKTVATTRNWKTILKLVVLSKSL